MTKNGKPCLKGNCRRCGCKKSQFVKMTQGGKVTERAPTDQMRERTPMERRLIQLNPRERQELDRRVEEGEEFGRVLQELEMDRARRAHLLRQQQGQQLPPPRPARPRQRQRELNPNAVARRNLFNN